MNEQSAAATLPPGPRTTEQWWDETRASDERVVDWLQRQFHGEVLGAKLMREYLQRFGDQVPAWATTNLEIIVRQEGMHAKWIADLLRARGAEAKVLTKRERYFEELLPHIRSFEGFVAATVLTEEMALEKDVIISTHPMTPIDVRTVFRRVRVDEAFHAAFYGALANADAVEEMRRPHRAAMEAIGLRRSS